MEPEETREEALADWEYFEHGNWDPPDWDLWFARPEWELLTEGIPLLLGVNPDQPAWRRLAWKDDSWARGNLSVVEREAIRTLEVEHKKGIASSSENEVGHVKPADLIKWAQSQSQLELPEVVEAMATRRGWIDCETRTTRLIESILAPLSRGRRAIGTALVSWMHETRPGDNGLPPRLPWSEIEPYLQRFGVSVERERHSPGHRVFVACGERVLQRHDLDSVKSAVNEVLATLSR